MATEKKTDLELLARLQRRVKSLTPQGRATAVLFITKKVPYEDAGTVRGLLADYADLSTDENRTTVLKALGFVEDVPELPDA